MNDQIFNRYQILGLRSRDVYKALHSSTTISEDVMDIIFHYTMETEETEFIEKEWECMYLNLIILQEEVTTFHSLEWFSPATYLSHSIEEYVKTTTSILKTNMADCWCRMTSYRMIENGQRQYGMFKKIFIRLKEKHAFQQLHFRKYHDHN